MSSGADRELDLRAIRAAAKRISGHVHRTPVLTSRSLNQIAGAEVFLKAECLQRSGSFKARGAFNRLSALDSSERRRGVVAYSSGNHGAAVALAAAELGVPAAVVVPSDAAPAKLEAIDDYGAEIIRCDPAGEDRAVVAGRIARERAMTLIAPYDDYEVMAGQGTLALELAEQAPALDLLYVPVGGGGLLAGVATAVRGMGARTRLIGVEPADADDTRRSLATGCRAPLGAAPSTIADGLRTPQPGELTFPIVRALVDTVTTVTDAEIVAAMRLCFERLKLVVEPSGAVALAALLHRPPRCRAATVGVVLSGGNLSPQRFAELVGAGACAPALDPGGRSRPPAGCHDHLKCAPASSARHSPTPALAGLQRR